MENAQVFGIWLEDFYNMVTTIQLHGGNFYENSNFLLDTNRKY